MSSKFFADDINDLSTAAAATRDDYIAKHFPGHLVSASSVKDALTMTGANFTVQKHPLICGPILLDGEQEHRMSHVPMQVGMVRMDTGEVIGTVGPNYGVVQTADAFQALEILTEREDLQIRNVQIVNGGARIRVTALLGVTEFLSITSQPNTICHFGIFEATHDGTAKTTATAYSVRLESLSGLTSRDMVNTYGLKHTSKVGERVERHSSQILKGLIGDAQAEAAMFSSMVNREMKLTEFENFAHMILGGPIHEDDSQTKKTRRENQMEELVGIYNEGNQGAGSTAWGAYNTIASWLEIKREKYRGTDKEGNKFDSNLSGDGQSKLRKSLKLLTQED